MNQRNYFILGTLESLVALIWIISIPGDVDNAWLLGFSQRRWLILLPVILVFLFLSGIP